MSYRPQYGDEGKARVVDMLAKDYDVIARFNGEKCRPYNQTNEGVKSRFNKFHQNIYPDKLLYVGSGCVINIEKSLWKSTA